MSPTKTVATALTIPLLTPWMAGPSDPVGGPVVVSVTEYQAHHRRELPGVALRGWRMRAGWYAMRGAVGVWLWSIPATARAGSISVWVGEDDLKQFVTLPHHVDIMARYGGRGTVRSTLWHVEPFDPAATIDRARAWIAEESA
ncbi:MAG: hypothetical protein QOE04_3157 [Mycobacterium sp.]|jgi:hypothetical protein|nr:hypothetical protein [Mycobacterium sp.]MDT5389516.1 hypothetical protein [Mycobacterium sp.]MDT5397663.1 hypothetical protein [Mycobacterium sp.]MDT7758781.1 hypothetical protein [Mycobacterium sp.]